jgi:hypothetical protein
VLVDQVEALLAFGDDVGAAGLAEPITASPSQAPPR